MSTTPYTALPSWLLTRAATRAHRLVHEHLSRAGSTGYEYRVLSAVEAGPASQADIGRSAALDRRDVAVTVATLEAKEWVSRSRSAADSRKHVVSLTPTGRRRKEDLDAVMRAVQAELLSGLAAEEVSQLVSILERLDSRE
jgi:DNA-binding MarR family transcriptional regulator